MLSLGQNILEGQVAVVVLSVCVLVCVSVCVPMPCEPGYEARVELITIPLQQVLGYHNKSETLYIAALTIPLC